MMKILCGDARHDSVNVEVKRMCWQLRSEKQRELEAERMPPTVPITSRWLLESRKRGKIDRSLIVSGFCNLVS